MVPTLLVIFLIVMTGPPGRAEGMNSEAVYRRCYAHLVRARVPADDSLLLEIKSGKIKAPPACMALIRRAGLNDDGMVNTKDPVAKSILRTFQSLHSSWFSNHELIRVETNFPASNMFDTGQMGYYFTRQILSQPHKFSDIVTLAHGWRGRRQHAAAPRFFIDTKGNKRVSKLVEKSWGANDGKPFRPEFVEFGPLIGIQRAPAGESNTRIVEGEPWTFNWQASRGAGFLGTPSYILLSTTLPQCTEPDGALAVHRAWSSAVLKDLLCRGLPVIEPEDARGVTEEAGTPPFRRKASCMQCHSTMDPMAGVLRNLEIIETTADKGDLFRGLSLMGFTPGSPLRGPASVQAYSHAAPEGTLYMRDFRGRLIDEPVADLPQLGRVLAAHDDMYICTAKRYFEFFTGIDVQIRNFSKDPDGVLSSPYFKYRDFVVELAEKLKADQDLPRMIERIFTSRYYQSTSYGVEL